MIGKTKGSALALAVSIVLAHASASAADLASNSKPSHPDKRAIIGGDAIIAPDGSVFIIDINDWPSFAPVREQASRCIAGLLIQRINGHDTNSA